MTAPSDSDNPADLAERHYVGACLHLRGQQARAALNRIQVTDLADPQLRAIVQALHSIVADGHDPDPARVTPRMLELGLVPRDKARLANLVIVDLLADVPHPACWPVYVAQVLRESARRTIREIAERAIQAADGPDLKTALQVLGAGLVQAATIAQRAVAAEGGDPS